MYKVRCYNRNGDLHHEDFYETLDEAKKRRTEWGRLIGLKPEPSTDFAYYPTIWKRTGINKFERLEGY